jgi:PKD repeat protein
LLGLALLGAVVAVVAVGGLGAVGGPQSSFVVAGQTAATPTANCTLSDTEAPPGTNVTLYAFESANADGYRYDKQGDGTYETDVLTDTFYTFEYTTNGTYTPTVRVRNDTSGETDTATCGTLTIDANEPPAATVSYSPSNPDVGEQMTFDPNGTADPDGDDVFSYEYDWDGDGTYEGFTEVESTITHTYDTRGSKTVTFRAEDEHGGVGTATVSFFVGDREPIARCSVTPESVHVGEEIQMDARASENASSADFDPDGDGTYETVGHVDFLANYSYETADTYEVRALLQNGEQTNETFCGTVSVTENEPPTAALTITPSDPMTGESVTFDASGSSDTDGSVETYRWDFDGDGTVERETNDSSETYQFDASGSYVPSVTVVDDDGATGEASRDLSVEDEPPPPTTLCTIEDTTVTVGESTTVDASGSDGPTTVEFDTDGDGTYERTDSEDFVIDVSYDAAGEYTVQARGSNEGGSDVAECGTITVDQQETETPVGTETTTETVTDETPIGTETVTDETPIGTETVTDEPPVGTETVIDETPIETETVIDETPIETETVTDETPVETETATETETDDTPVETETDDTPVGTETLRTDRYPTTTDRVFTEPPVTETVPTADREGEEGRNGTTTGRDETSATTTTADESGLPIPAPPDGLLPAVGVLLGLGGLGGAAYYFAPTGGAGGGGGGSGTPPKPPSTPPSGGSRAIETGTFLTPTESGPVTVTGLGFEPDFLAFVATTNVRPASDSWPSERSDGWCHGRAVGRSDGTIPQTSVTLTDDTRNLDAAMGVSSDGHAIELDVYTDGPPERLTGRVTALTDDGFEVDFDVSALPDDREGDQYVVHYQAFSLGGEDAVEIGHFRTPEYPGSQSIPLGIDADHVILTATNTLGTIDDRRMTDLPIGFSHGEVVGRTDPAQVVRNVTADPSGLGGTARGAFDDRALHLLYAADGDLRGRTTATVTSLGESIDLEYEKVYSGPGKIGSVESKLVTYVAVRTGPLQPTVGHFQLPDAGSEERVAVELGFEPRLVEFTTLGVDALGTDEMARASALGFGWSHGSVIGGREEYDGVRQYVLNDALDAERSTHEPHTGPAHDGVAAAVRSLADGGHIGGRAELTVTEFTDEGFRIAVTDVGSDRDDGSAQPYVFYKAWPKPEEVTN